MDNLDSSFTVEINGAPIAKVGANAEDRIQAETGSEAAVFTLNSGRLRSGDWILGRSTTENRSLLPKPVFWFKSSEGSEGTVGSVTAHRDGDAYQLKFDAASLIVEDGKVFADPQEDTQPGVRVKLQA